MAHVKKKHATVRTAKAPTAKQRLNYQANEIEQKALKVAEGPDYARLEARVSPELKLRFQQAANILGRTLTDFMVSALDEIASRTIKQHQVIELSFADQQAFVEALLNPPEPSNELKRALKRYKKLGL